MKITVITGAQGHLVAIVHAHLSEHERLPPDVGLPTATLRAQEGQVFHEIVAPDELEAQPRDVLRRWVVEHAGIVTAGAKSVP